MWTKRGVEVTPERSQIPISVPRDGFCYSLLPRFLLDPAKCQQFRTVNKVSPVIKGSVRYLYDRVVGIIIRMMIGQVPFFHKSYENDVKIFITRAHVSSELGTRQSLS